MSPKPSNNAPRRFAAIAHIVTFAACAAAGVWASLSRDIVPPRQDDPISAITGLVIDPDSLVYVDAPAPEAPADCLKSHEILFLARAGEGRPRDLYRAEADIDENGRIWAVGAIRNLTRTPHGDDFYLEWFPPHALVATRALGQVRSLTVFDTTGSRESENRAWSPLTQILGRLSNYFETGRFAGLAQTTVTFNEPVGKLAVSDERDRNRARIALSWTDPSGRSRRGVVALADGKTTHPELRVRQARRLPKKPILWMVDTLRSLPWLGPGPIEWLEGRFFALSDALRRVTRTAYYEPQIATNPQNEGDHLIEMPGDLPVSPGGETIRWPPRPLERSKHAAEASQEGLWHPGNLDFTQVTPGSPPVIYRTFVRPDEERSDIVVHLFALDMRRLELHMTAGLEDPRSTTGAQGEGRFPRDEEILQGVVAAFNGAFKTVHGSYGMMVERDLLVPPVEGAATLATFENGRATLSTWPKGGEIPDDMVSFRQNLEPLLDKGQINPSRRTEWGIAVTSSGDIVRMYTIRSGLCRRDDGTLVYAWGENLDAATLAKAMKRAECAYGMHLDMNPYHTAFLYYKFQKGDAERLKTGHKVEYQVENALHGTVFSADRYVYASPKDFFFLVAKRPLPGPDWSPEGLAQPSPSYFPTMSRKAVDGTQLIAVDLQRTRLVILPGDIPSPFAPPEETARGPGQGLLATIVLGPWAKDRGQKAGGHIAGQLSPHDPLVGITRSGDLYVGPPPEPSPLGSPEELPDLVQGLDGPNLEPRLSPETPAIGLCIHENRRLIAARGPAGEIDAVLADEGCDQTALFPREDPEQPAILVRGAEEMIDLDDTPVESVDASLTVLELFAR